MQDRFGRNKWAFWLFVCSLAAVTLLPSAVLLHALQSYCAFLTGAVPGTIRPVPVSFLDRRAESRSEPDANLRFVEFRLRAPQAKAVKLMGDFNGWKADTLPLARAGKDSWEIMLPLPPGRYHYLFLVDGRTQADPRAGTEAVSDGKTTSMRLVP